MFLIQTLSALAIGTKLLSEEIVIPVFCLLVLPIVTFLLAQGAKRCHDFFYSAMSISIAPFLPESPYFARAFWADNDLRLYFLLVRFILSPNLAGLPSITK
ncbi:hypothetical protein [Runella sp. MFBS21]|uniref:hypothetical protein n=1 Tax=Runella sp. MFBS21 TaxID=3034018 RepID=UPI0038F5D1BA